MTSLSPEQMLCFALYSASNAVQQTYKPLLDPLGLTYPQYIVMSALWREDGVKMRALGQTVSLEANSLTPVVKRLEARGLLRRERSVVDERKVLIHLTEEGKALQAQAGEAAKGFLDCSGLDPKAAQELRDAVSALRNQLKSRLG